MMQSRPFGRLFCLLAHGMSWEPIRRWSSEFGRHRPDGGRRSLLGHNCAGGRRLCCGRKAHGGVVT
ncbi:hypothetical protein CBM2605_A170307 [Cupriavidus neocaledonicus]|uniref:Transposase n=1 Tax=Cupriavidus neocaledonicus TaxID=1040979 RepID=A0ABY1UY99_9BURK|nr:hypothetical protein CBM2605_A170307 [Cupriavidus neocaledonicus]